LVLVLLVAGELVFLAVSSGRTERRHMVCGTVLDSLLGQIDAHLGFIPTDPDNLARRYLRLFAVKPMPDFDDQLTDRPALVVKIKTLHMADVAI
jgi:hypothetical protein